MLDERSEALSLNLLSVITINNKANMAHNLI